MSYQVRIARDAERDIAGLHAAVVPRIFKAIKRWVWIHARKAARS